MKSLFAVFKDDPETPELVVEGEDAPTYFEGARSALSIGGRPVAGLWLIDAASNNRDVVAIFGSVPIDIAERHVRWQDWQ